VNEPVNPILVGGERGDPTGLKKKCFVGLFFLEDVDFVLGFGKESAESKISRGGYPFSTISL
jgi:hypothetical protein